MVLLFDNINIVCFTHNLCAHLIRPNAERRDGLGVGDSEQRVDIFCDQC